MENKEIRRRNLRLLVEEAGTVAALADRCKVSAAYLSQIRSSKHPAEVGDDLARRLERGMKKDVGWMDTPQWGRQRNSMPAPNPQEWDLLDAYRDCERGDQEKIFDLCQRLRKSQ